MSKLGTDVFVLIQEGRSREEILKATAQLSDDQIQQSAGRLNAKQIDEIELSITETLQLVGMKRLLTSGCYLELWAKASREAENPQRFCQMCERFGIRRATGFEYRRVWRAFGKRIMEQPRLARFMVPESLKILSRESTPAEAVSEAFTLAAQEQFVSIKVANELKERFTESEKETGPQEVEQSTSQLVECEPELPPPAPAKRSFAGSAWEFTGRVLRIVATAKDVDAIIQDLKQAIEKLERERNVNARIASFYSTGNESHG